MTPKGKALEVSRRIEAPAAAIFEIVANPQRHIDIDGSDMLRGADMDRPIAKVGETFIMKMHRMGTDYQMINYVVEFEPDRHVVWEPAPGDLDHAGGDASRIGVPAGYRWGYTLKPEGENATLVTEIFDCGPKEMEEHLLQDGGSWINGSNSIVELMAATLERLDAVCTGHAPGG